jgi:hypothetical protein
MNMAITTQVNIRIRHALQILMNTLKFFLSLLFLALASVQFSCKKNDVQADRTPAKKMVLVYMEANNDLRYDALNSINMMEKGAADLDGTLLVYIKTTATTSYLLRIKHDTDENRIMSDTVKVFNSDLPSDTQFMHDVIAYAQKEFPAESYGLVLWSHATSWAPPSGTVKTRSFGQDAGKEMDIIDLKNALPDNLDLLIFDACSMGGVEVLYEFRDKAKYIIASPTETLAESFPYQTVAPLLFGNADRFPQLAKAYYDHYNAYPDDRRSATVVLVKTSELAGLAAQMRTLIMNNKAYGDVLVSSGVQRLDITRGFPVANYDLGDLLDHNFPATGLVPINAQLDRTILYKASTPDFLGIPIKKFSGLSTYITYPGDPYLPYYKKLQWYSAAGLTTIFGM